MRESAAIIGDALAGRRPVRTPIFDIFCNDRVIEHFSGRRFDGADDREVAIRAASSGLDGTRWLGIPYRENDTYSDWVGNIYRTARWTSWVEKHRFESSEEWAEWLPTVVEELESRPLPTEDQRLAEQKTQGALNGRLASTVYIHATPSTSLNTAMFGYRCGLDNLSYLWADHPDLVLRWLRAIERDELAKIDLCAHRETSPMAMIYSDVAFKNRLMFSREMFRELGFFDNVARICSRCHEGGLKVIFHSDGDITGVMDDLVAAGIDGLNPLEKAAGVDVYALRKRYPELILVGGVDVTHLLPAGTPDEVRREVRRMIDELGSEGRLLIGSSTEVGNDVPLENYLAFHDEVMKG